MNSYTIKLSYQKGRKLGFVLVDSLVTPGSYYESDSEDGGVLSNNIRGGGEEEEEEAPPPSSLPMILANETGTTLDVLNEIDKIEAKDVNHVQPPIIGGSLQADFTAEAIEAKVVKQGRPSRRQSAPSRTRSKRKRPTRITVSPNSIVFKISEELLLTALKEEGCTADTFDVRKVDKLMQYGREFMTDVKCRNGSISFDEINSDAMMFAISGTVHKNEYTRQQSPVMA